jgi:superfamily II DNA/RNA helicase
MDESTKNKNLESILKLLKSGKSVLSVGHPDDYHDFIPSILSEIIPKPEEGSPRAIVFCTNDESAKALHEQTAKALKSQDLTVDLIFEKGNKLKQRNDLFDGTEIIIGTPKRICELYFQNGFNIGKLKLLIINQMDEQMRLGHKGFISRVAESLPKCRQLVFTLNPDEERTNDYLDKLAEQTIVFDLEQD